MGSSYLEFKDKGFWSRDWTIELWKRFLVLEIDKINESSDWLRNLRNEWDIEAQGIGVGINGIFLDRYATTEEQRQLLITLASGALAAIEQYGEFIPKSVVEVFPRHEGEGEWNSDENTADVRCLALYFMKLLNGEYPLTGSEWGRPIEFLCSIEGEYDRWFRLFQLKNNSS